MTAHVTDARVVVKTGIQIFWPHALVIESERLRREMIDELNALRDAYTLLSQRPEARRQFDHVPLDHRSPIV